MRTSFYVAELNADGTYTTDDDFIGLGSGKPSTSAKLVAPVPWLLSLLAPLLVAE